VNWNARYAVEMESEEQVMAREGEILDRFRRGLTNFYGTADAPTGNRIVHKPNDNVFEAQDARGRVLGRREYGYRTAMGEPVDSLRHNYITHLEGKVIENSSEQPGVGLALDHATAQHCTSRGLGFICSSIEARSSSRPNQGLDSRTYHTAVGRPKSQEINSRGMEQRFWPRELMASISRLKR
jgi:hypothetical protein